MSLIVQKFGGSSVANAERVMNVAKIVTDTFAKGNDVVVVVSAQGDTTDDLIEKAQEINPNASRREKDMLLAAGEQISISLLAMAIEKLGYHAVSLLGWQAGFETTSAHTSARIKRVDASRIRRELDKKNIVVVAGFQGLSKYGDVTTLGRGGSDTSAVAIAASMHADLCQIYTDVEGVYTADPRKVKNIISRAKPDEHTILYMDYGSGEWKNHKGIRRLYGEVSSMLIQKGVLLNSRVVPYGEHCEASWERQIPFFMKTLQYRG